MRLNYQRSTCSFIISDVREFDKFSGYSAISTKGNNFFDFLFAFLHIKLLRKRGLESKCFTFRIDPFSEVDKSNFVIVTSLKNVEYECEVGLGFATWSINFAKPLPLLYYTLLLRNKSNTKLHTSISKQKSLKMYQIPVKVAEFSSVLHVRQFL